MVDYILKSVPANRKAHGGFEWPAKAGVTVTAPDWNTSKKCGGGLHGALNGQGDGELFCWDENGVWIVAEILGDYVDLGGKVKCQSCVTRVVGSRHDATQFLQRLGHTRVIGATATAGDGGTATAGYRGTATAGDHGTATAGGHGTATAGEGGAAASGNHGTATAGDYGTATAGDGGAAKAGDGGTATAGYRGTATAGDGGTATAGNDGTATAGDGGTATAGNFGTATAGFCGTATAGKYGTATAGDGGTAKAGEGGTAKAGEGGTVAIAYYDRRQRLAVGYIGENGLLPNIPCRVVNGKIVQDAE